MFYFYFKSLLKTLFQILIYFITADLAGIRSFIPEQEMKTRIIGGHEAWAYSWPWQVSLQFGTTPACGGAIISPLWVVSAAHCFRRSEVAPEELSLTSFTPF